MNTLKNLLLGILVWQSLLLDTSSRLYADDWGFPDPDITIKTHDWVISPAAEPSSALRIRLHSDITETVPGNAAAFYLRAILGTLSVTRRDHAQSERVTEWSQFTSDQLPIADVKQWLATQQFVLDEIVSANRCESCDWGIRFQDVRGRGVIEMRLAEFQEMRQLARLLKLKAQVEIAERRFDDAVGTLRMMYRMARDLGQAPNVIVSLISTAITAVTNDVLGELITTEQSPNFYWALRLMPDPLPDQQTMARLDMNLPFQWFPFLHDAETTQYSSEEWMRLVTTAIHEIRQLNGDSSSGKEADAVTKLSATMLILRSYPIAKRDLQAKGMDAAQLDRMPVGQVVAIYAGNCFRHVASENLKWFSLPYHEGLPRLQRLNEELQRDGYLSTSPTVSAERDPLLFNRSLMPAFYNLENAYLRQRRMNALLATIEAVRMHAAANQGKLPGQLSEIMLVPVPLDPASMKPFLYRVVDGRAELVALPTRPGDEYSGRRFHLRIR